MREEKESEVDLLGGHGFDSSPWAKEAGGEGWVRQELEVFQGDRCYASNVKSSV